MVSCPCARYDGECGTGWEGGGDGRWAVNMGTEPLYMQGNMCLESHRNAKECAIQVT